MIQRVQSLYLLLAVIISTLLLFIPVYQFQPVSETVQESRNFTLASNSFLTILNVAIGVLCFVAIFIFKNRNLQIRICNLALMLTCVLIGLLFFWADTMSNNANQKVHYMYGSYLPLVQILFIFLANRSIRKDDELVRSADRLR